MSLVQLNSATKSFGQNTVLKDINLSIPEGELVVILGSNGAGKTTLLRIIAGLLGLDQGDLKIDASPLNRLSEEQRQKIFLLPDFPVLFDHLSVLENVETWLSLYRKESEKLEAESMQLLERFNLAAKSRQPASSLSRGQRYKLALVLYEGSKAPIGLFDEPFASGMDASGIREMRRLFRDAISDQQRSIIYTTQLVGYAREFADRILIIHDAQIYFDGTPTEFQIQLESGDPVLEIFSESDE